MPARIPIDLKQLEELAAHGLNVREAAGELGVSEVTLITRIGRDPQASEAWRRGRALAKRTKRDATENGSRPAPPEEKPQPVSPVNAVLQAISRGFTSRQEIKEHTGLTYDVINDAIDLLALERGAILMTMDKMGTERYQLRGRG